MFDEPIHTLLIEDNAEHTELLSRQLAESDSAQFQLQTATTLKAGLALVAQNSFELIILDLSLPDCEGVETFLNTMDAAPDVAIVVLSGTQDIAVAIETVHLGAQDYLVKGRFDAQLLIRALQYSVERKRAARQILRVNGELEQRVRERTAALVEMNLQLQTEVAERKKAEEAALDANRQLAAALQKLEATQEQVIRRERMHALGSMAQGMAHDFNNALAPILGFSELLLLKPELLDDKTRLRGYLEIIHTSAKESERVTSRLREFYRYRDAEEVFTSIRMNDLILQAVAITQPRWKDQSLAAGVTIDIRTEMGSVPMFRGNETELREMLVNLIFNAVDAIVKRGTVVIRTEQQSRSLAVSVTDDGVGMTEEVRARCLDPFFSTKDADTSGFGLGTVYGIVRRHEGEIDIRSDVGRGTTVTVTFPLERGTKAAEERATPPTGSGQLHILVVEDEPLVRDVLSVYLEEDKHKVTLAVNGRDGLEKFANGHFDIVLTDRAMPELNGDQLAAEIKKVKPSQPVVMLTGFGNLMAGAGEKPDGVDLVVSKPFTLATLRHAINSAIGHPAALAD